MNNQFGRKLKQLRTQQGITQQQLAAQLFVERATISNWEAGRRVPDFKSILQISEFFKIDLQTLIQIADTASGDLNVLIADSDKRSLSNSLVVVKQVLPDAELRGFTNSHNASAYFSSHPAALALLDIEPGVINGLDLCREFLSACPHSNIVFLTQNADFSYEAWDTGACGFLLKPLTEDSFRQQLTRLRYPIIADT